MPCVHRNCLEAALWKHWARGKDREWQLKAGRRMHTVFVLAFIVHLKSLSEIYVNVYMSIETVKLKTASFVMASTVYTWLGLVKQGPLLIVRSSEDFWEHSELSQCLAVVLWVLSLHMENCGFRPSLSFHVATITNLLGVLHGTTFYLRCGWSFESRKQEWCNGIICLLHSYTPHKLGFYLPHMENSYKSLCCFSYVSLI